MMSRHLEADKWSLQARVIISGQIMLSLIKLMDWGREAKGGREWVREGEKDEGGTGVGLKMVSLVYNRNYFIQS